MNVLVTGSNGFIGTNLINSLKIMPDIQVTGIDKDDFDIADLPLSYDLGPFDRIVHLAAEAGVLDSRNRQEQVIRTNILGTQKLLNIPCEKFIFVSSCAADDPKSSLYAMSKYCGEYLCNQHNASIIRLSNVYGPHSIHKQSVVHKFIKNIIDEKPLTVNGSGHQVRSFIYVYDVIGYLIGSIKSNIRDIWSLSGGVCSISDLIYKLSLITDLPEIVYCEGKGEVEVPNITRRNCWTDLNTGLKETFNWYMEYYHGTKHLG